MSEELSMAILELAHDDVPEMIGRRLEAGEDPLAILAECREGMTRVGQRFQDGDYYLAELLLSAEIFKAAVAQIEPHLPATARDRPAGTVVLATMRGDIHDLGKNILATLLRAHAFEVHDLGVNVEPAVLVDKVREVRPDFVGLSVLITTAFRSMQEARRLLEEAGLRDSLHLMIGGGVTTPELKTWLGADFQSLDASEGVAWCIERAEAR
jgi:methylmalonyl-CoA mutase cobalamin-binding domain/chain